MDEIWNEALLQDKAHTLQEGLAWLQTTAAVKSGVWFDEAEGEGEGEGAGDGDGRGEREEREGRAGEHSSAGGGSGGGGSGDALDSHIQQKIVPWDNLDLVRLMYPIYMHGMHI